MLNPSPLWAEGAPDWGDVDLLVLNGGELESPAVPARDASGAGDAFCGVLVGLMARSVGRGEALARAVAAASISVTRVGALASCPISAEIDALAAQSPIRSTS